MTNGYLPQMDGFRGLFCLFIVIIHLHYNYVNLPLSIGYLGMHGFFILSSYLITRGLLSDKKKATSFRHFFVSFYIKRILRIFPVYFLYLAFAFVVGLMTAQTPYKSILGIMYELKYFGWMLLSFTYNFKDLYALFAGLTYNKSLVFPHLWSLSLEEQFYFIVPFMVYFLSEKNIKRLTLMMIFLFPLIRIVGYQWLSTLTDDTMLRSFIMYRCTIFQYDAFFYGALVALFPISWSARILKWVFNVLLILFILSIAGNGWYLHTTTGEAFFKIITHYDFMTRNGQYIYIDVLMNSLFVVFCYLSFRDSNYFSFLNNKALVYIGGKTTYSMYVYQYIFIIPTLLFVFPFLLEQLQIGRFASELISMVLSVAGLLLLSHFSYITLETYFLKKKDYFLSKVKK